VIAWYGRKRIQVYPSTESSYPVQPRHSRGRGSRLRAPLSPSQRDAAAAPCGGGTRQETAGPLVRQRPQRGRADGRRRARTRRHHPARPRVSNQYVYLSIYHVPRGRGRKAGASTSRSCRRRRSGSCGRRGGGHDWAGWDERLGEETARPSPVGCRVTKPKTGRFLKSSKTGRKPIKLIENCVTK
jgi:hypothetical protein